MEEPRGGASVGRRTNRVTGRCFEAAEEGQPDRLGESLGAGGRGVSVARGGLALGSVRRVVLKVYLSKARNGLVGASFMRKLMEKYDWKGCL